MEPDHVTTPIRYDTWTAMVMTESVYFLIDAGFLAHRGPYQPVALSFRK
jgi:hypothetical protein